MDATYWIVEGFDGCAKLFEEVVPGYVSEQEVITLLQRLVCSHLATSDIIDASASWKGASRTGALQPHFGKSDRRGMKVDCISVGESRFYIASRPSDPSVVSPLERFRQTVS